MNPPAKPSPLHMLVVCIGLIMLFVGTWTLVKKASPAPQKEVVKTTSNSSEPSSRNKVKNEDKTSSPSSAQAETKQDLVPKSKPATDPALASASASAPNQNPPSAPPAMAKSPDVDSAVSPSVATSQAPPSTASTQPTAEANATPQSTAFAITSAPSSSEKLSMRVPETPAELTVASSPTPPAEENGTEKPTTKTADESSQSNQTSEEKMVGPVEYHGPPSPEHQPSPIPIAAKIDPKDPPFPPAADTPIQMPEPPKVADKNDKNIKDVTDSKASHHDMEAEPEDGPVNQPPGTVAEKTTDIKPTTSSALPGWELLRYASRDYVTANSIHRFYRFTHLKVDGKNVWFTSPQLVMKAYIGSHELLINNIKFVMSYPVIELNNKPCFSRLDLCKLIDPVLRPSYISNSKPFDTVVIDPGHGGSDGGARGIYGHEKDFALKLGLLLKRALEQKGLKVVMTRDKDVFVSLANRVAIANKTPNSIYISLHYNSGGSSATGIETFALTPQGGSSIYGSRSVDSLAFQGNQLDSQNIALATAVHAGVIDHFKFVDRGVKRARWRVLTTLQRPGILFEGGFVTNANDGRLIAADNYRQEMANTIAQSIINYRNALNPRRASSR